MSNIAVTVVVLSSIITFFLLLNLGVMFLRKSKYISKKRTDRLVCIRFSINLVLMMIIIVLLIVIMLDSDPVTIAYLSQNQCSNDEILNRSFVTMNEYFSTLRMKNYIAISLVIILLLLDIIMFAINTWT
jgi:hypothetical protein